MMEKALRYELLKAIPELNNSIYPTNAPETSTKPYLVYTRINTKIDKTLLGFENTKAMTYLFSVMATRYEDMVSLRDRVEHLLKDMIHKKIGKDEIEIQDLNINNIDEQYEHSLLINRGIIDFTIYI